MRTVSSLLFAASLALASGCDCSGSVSCGSDDECQTGTRCRDGVCVEESDGGSRRDAGDPDPTDAGPTRCTADSQCGGGVCVEGACCPSAGAVCGASCCEGAEVCFANACVVPGASCRTADDCAEGEYCEPSLGDGPSTPDGGVPTDGGSASCLGDAPSSGRCVALPPLCEGDPAPGEVCRRECEYRPDPDGPLDAVVQWKWDASNAVANPGRTDVWSTPTVGRLTDTNCDGAVDELDPPNIVFVSGATAGTCCGCGAANVTTCKSGALRALDGRTGREVWTSRLPSSGSLGWSGVSVALGDVDHDGDMEVAAVTGEGHVAIVDHAGAVVAVSDLPIPSWGSSPTTGWGGGLSIADMDHDGDPEIAYGRVVFTTDGASVTRLWIGTGGWGRAFTQAISAFVNLDDDPELELLAGRTAYEPDGTIKWIRNGAPAGAPPAIPAGFSAVANFDADPEPEVVHVAAGRVYLLSAATGADELPSAPAMGSSPGSGGPPTIADFDGDGQPEFGVAWRQFYQVFEADYAGGALTSLWATPNHDLSSSVTGSTVFDFEGDGAAEVIYNDECFLWVYDGRTGAVRFATLTTSFTATEASLVADVDGDGSAEIVMVSNSASAVSWHCAELPWTRAATEGEPDFGRPAWVGSDGATASYRGITVLRAADDSWVGTRTLWNQHAYSVSNVCGDRGDACSPPSGYGDIPERQVANWTVGFLNNFRQNIQGEGIFDAPDATVSLAARCETPVRLVASVRNLGARLLPAGVEVGFYVLEGGVERELGRGTTSTPLFPGQVATVELDAPADIPAEGSLFRARILVDPATPTFRECRDDNNQSADVEPRCLM